MCDVLNKRRLDLNTETVSASLILVGGLGGGQGWAVIFWFFCSQIVPAEMGNPARTQSTCGFAKIWRRETTSNYTTHVFSVFIFSDIKAAYSCMADLCVWV